MYKHLYDNFKHWYRGGSIYFYSDPHFNDEEMKYLRKNYIDDDEQVRAINKKIGKNDTFVCLGDVGDLDFVRKIRGYKVLVMGNHDAGASNYKRIIDELIYDADELSLPEVRVIIKKHYPNWKIVDIDEIIAFEPPYNRWRVKIDNCLFDEVYEGSLCISEKIILSHEPIDIPFMLNIHGHDHSGLTFQDGKHINLCAENIGYTPVGIKEIVTSGILGKIDSIHRITIDIATKRSKLK